MYRANCLLGQYALWFHCSVQNLSTNCNRTSTKSYIARLTLSLCDAVGGYLAYVSPDHPRLICSDTIAYVCQSFPHCNGLLPVQAWLSGGTLVPPFVQGVFEQKGTVPYLHLRSVISFFCCTGPGGVLLLWSHLQWLCRLRLSHWQPDHIQREYLSTS